MSELFVAGLSFVTGVLTGVSTLALVFRTKGECARLHEQDRCLESEMLQRLEGKLRELEERLERTDRLLRALIVCSALPDEEKRRLLRE